MKDPRPLSVQRPSRAGCPRGESFSSSVGEPKAHERLTPLIQAVGRLRRSILTGRPLGGDRFVARLETLLGRRLRPARRPAENEGAETG